MNKLLRLTFITLLCMYLAACAAPEPYDISMLSAQQSYSRTKVNKNLVIHVSDKFPHPEFIGGTDYSSNINFQDITLWLQQRLRTINRLECHLQQVVDINITIKKLYIAKDSNVLVGTLSLNMKTSTAGAKTISKNYRNDCKLGFFNMDERSGVRSCLNEALDAIIPRMKHDICKIKLR